MTFTVSLVILGMTTLSLLASLGALRLSQLAVQRKQPPALPASPAAVCHCGGNWGKWERLDVKIRSGFDVKNRYGLEPAIQERTCGECGITERRIIK